MNIYTKIFLFTTLHMWLSKIWNTINSVNPLYLMLNKMNGYFEEINGNKYLTLVPTNESRKNLKSMKNCGLKLEI